MARVRDRIDIELRKIRDKLSKEAVKACGELGCAALTLYAFSTENWVRPAAEVKGLMDLLCLMLRQEIEELDRSGVRLQAIGRLREQGCDRILAFPLYPQYAASSTGSALDAVFRVMLKMRNMPELRTVRQYHDHPAYIAALEASVRWHWMTSGGKPDKLIMSFHGVPRYTLDKGDPYHCVCQKTGRLLAEALGLNSQQYMVCFQSRFGRAEWLKPYLAQTLEELGRQKTGRVDVICPGFSSDCLETLEEIAMEGKATFIGAGGREYHYIPALNERDEWIHAMVEIALEHLHGWVVPDWDMAKEQQALNQSRLRALAMGAKN